MGIINSNINEIQISGIRKFMAIANKVEHAIHLTIGEPDFPTPEHIKEAGIHAIHQNQTQYTPNGGKLDLRLATSKYFFEKYGIEYDGEKEIIVTHGATQALDTTFRTILEPGDEVIIPAPVYPGYAPIIQLCGAKPIWIDTTESNFKLTVKQLEEKITSRTKAILLPYPNNPTGVTLTDTELKVLVRYIEKQNVWIVSDEIYSEILYNGSFTSLGNFPEVREKAIIIQGLSKSHAMTGWRIGFLLGPESFIESAIKVQQYNITCPSTISQAAAFAAVTSGKDDPLFMKKEYMARRDYLAGQLKDIGFDVSVPEGTFYLFLNHTKYHLDSYEFALKLLHEAGVAVTPGTAFDPYGNGYVRISFATSMIQLKEACHRIDQWIKKKNRPKQI